MTLTGNLISQVIGRSLGLNAEKLIHWVEEHFTDHSETLPKALAYSERLCVARGWLGPMR